MTRAVYLDCFSGAAGDMILAALIDAGTGLEALRAQLSTLPIDGYRITAGKVQRRGLAATLFDVDLDLTRPQPHRHLKDILKIISESKLSESVRARASRVFQRLAQAEAKVHGTSIEKVHFHEVGAVDAIVDVVGTAIALEILKIDVVYASPLPMGSGTITCQHGLMPVPAPATAELMVGFPTAHAEETGEMTTPTGAAIVTTLAERLGPMPAMRVEGIGCGCGHRDDFVRPNILRAIVGTVADDAPRRLVTVLETNIDDLSPECAGFAVERLLAEGALDAFVVPIGMKKGRPGILLTALCDPDRVVDMENVIFAETSTFGIRRHDAWRRTLDRRHEEVRTAYGTVRVKVGSSGGKVVTVSPEFEDCRMLASQTGAPLRRIMDEALRVWHTAERGEG